MIKAINNLLAELYWRLDLVHVPEWDNAPDPWPAQALPAPKREVEPRSDAPKKIRKAWDAEKGLGPNGKAQMIELIVKQNSEAEWEYKKHNGSNGGFDFSDWTQYDDEIIKEREFTERTTKNYLLVRADVLDGMTNQAIAKKHGYKIGWSEIYAGAVREMIRRRRKGLQVEAGVLPKH